MLTTNEEAKADYDYMKENLALKKQLAELQKENDFLKKQRHSFRRKSIRGSSIYPNNITKSLDLDGYYGNLISVRMLTIFILGIVKQDITKRKIKSKLQ